MNQAPMFCVWEVSALSHALVEDGSLFKAPGGRLEAVPGNIPQHGSKRVLDAASACARASAHLDP